MYAARPGITNHQCYALRKLALNVQVPCQGVTSRRTRLNVVDQQRIGDALKVLISMRERSGRKVGSASKQIERCSEQAEILRLIRQRQHVKNSKPASHGRFSIFEWIPGKAYSGLKIVQSRVRIVRFPDVKTGVR